MEIRPLHLYELAEAADGWPDEYELYLGRLRWHNSTPWATALGAVEHEAVRGSATGFRQGELGRITALRGRTDAISEALLDALLRELELQGCTGQVVHAQAGEEDFWRAQGFAESTPLLRYTGGRFIQATWDSIDHFEPRHRMAVMHLDRRASGEERSELLLEHEYLGRVEEEGGIVRGFTLALIGEGLTVANDVEVGLELLRWHFPIQEHVLLFEGNAAHAHLTERGYRAEPIGTRMVRGEVAPHRPGLIYAEPFAPVAHARFTFKK